MSQESRRNFLKIGGSVAAASLLGAGRRAFAAKNEGIRTALKYQDHPGPDNKECSTCMQFVPGKTPTALGGCKIYPGDTEISPKGYCTAWAKKP